VSDIYEPYDKLISIEVLGRRFEVPDNNLLLRQLAFVASDIAWGRYCWNGECRYCEIQYRHGGQNESPALACRIKGMEGMEVTKLAPEMKYNMSAALAATRKTSDR
jgi:hypothetical protein